MNPIAARVTGIQHIGLPTNDLKKTIEFYKGLGFEVIFETTIPTHYVAFLQLKNVCFEAFQAIAGPEAPGKGGAIAHICLDVDDIEATWEAVKAAGYTPIETEIAGLPYFEKGVRFFNITGPNGETIEFGQIL